MKLAPILAALALAAACAAPIAAPPQDTALRACDERFCRETIERGLEGWLAWFAPDASAFPAKGAIVHGANALRAHFERSGFPPPGLRWSPLESGVAASGDLGWTVGRWEIAERGAPERERAAGRYLTVWKKQEDGSWKVAADCGGASDWRARTPRAATAPISLTTDAVVALASKADDLHVRGGYWRASAAAGAAASGKFLSVWSRDADGSWRVVVEAGFADAP
jgi:ketosteroid isomerase-like protein